MTAPQSWPCPRSSTLSQELHDETGLFSPPVRQDGIKHVPDTGSPGISGISRGKDVCLKWLNRHPAVTEIIRHVKIIGNCRLNLNLRFKVPWNLKCLGCGSFFVHLFGQVPAQGCEEGKLACLGANGSSAALGAVCLGLVGWEACGQAGGKGKVAMIQVENTGNKGLVPGL